MEYPKRKNPRLRGYDYSQQGAYFVTLCTRERKAILSRIVVGPDALIGPRVELLPIGKRVEYHLRRMEQVYAAVSIAHYVVMPNHIHLLLCIEGENGPMRASGPTLSSMIRSLKRMVTRETGGTIWQASYHDHIIRDENDFLKHWNYIDQNPARWTEDEFYVPSPMSGMI